MESNLEDLSFDFAKDIKKRQYLGKLTLFRMKNIQTRLQHMYKAKVNKLERT